MTAKRIAVRKLTALAGALCAVATTLALAAPAPASAAAPAFDVVMSHQPAVGIPAGGNATYEISVSNSGNAPTSGPISVDFALPPAAGLEITGVSDRLGDSVPGGVWNCTTALDHQSASCTGLDLGGFYGGPFAIGQGHSACLDVPVLAAACRILVNVAADPGIVPGGSVTPTVSVSGGGAAVPADASDPTQTWPSYAITSFDGTVTDSGGNPYNQAGGNPYRATTSFAVTPTVDSSSFGFVNSSGTVNGQVPTKDIRDIKVDLPPGFVGNPSVIAKCTEAQLAVNACPGDSQVGTANLIGQDGGPLPEAVYNMVAPGGTPGELGFSVDGIVWVHLTFTVRSDGDYGLTVDVNHVNQTVAILGSSLSIWGVPADPSHDGERRCQNPFVIGCASGLAPKAFLSLPTSCPPGALSTTLSVNSWEDPDSFVSASFLSHDNFGNPLPIDGCAALNYSDPGTKPSLQARPTTTTADSPSGLDVDVHTPQNTDPGGVAEAHLKDTTIVLPKGLVVNPSGANGLGACTPAQIGLTTAVNSTPIHFTKDPPNCPDTAKIGTVEVDTPLVDHPLKGALYVASPSQNPFGSLLALYIVVNDPQTGLVVKLAGKVSLDKNTGQLTTTVTDAPQLPFEHFKVNVKSGAGAPLRTPSVCASYTTTSTLTPWSFPAAAAAKPSDTYAIDQGSNGGGCANSESAEPNSPTLDAGTVSPVAGAFSPLVVNLSRPDGSQNFSTVTLTPPPGLLGKLAATPYCPQSAIDAAAAKGGAAEQANPSCPAASQVGTVSAAAGAGPSPYYAPGNAYLAGPYKGAPLSLAIVTPATAGPFDLGTVVIRVALRIDPTTAQITAVSDPIPTILQGIPLDVRSAIVKLDKPNFTLNGTSCNPLSFGGSLLSTLGQTASLSSPFQLGECSALGFKPHLAISLKGATKRNGHPAFTSVLTYPQGNYANLAKAAVTLPPTMQLDQSHIQAPCTRPQFAAGQCPPASVIGTATATSPLVDYALSGPVYLRTGNNPLPDIVLALHGPASQPIEVDVVGKVDTVHARLRTTFETVPDAPVSQAVISLAGASKGLLVNNTNLCAQANKATVLLDGQNAKTADSTPKVSVAGCKPSHKPKHHKRHHRRHHRRAVR